MFNRSRRQYLRVSLALLCLTVTACDVRPPLERPREGAQPGGGLVRLETGPPPTLVGAASLSQTVTPTVDAVALPSPSPSPGFSLSPVASPGAYPVISGLQPAPGVSLPPGDVVIGARVTATNDLSDIVVTIDTETIPVDLSGPKVRSRSISLVRSFSLGQHEIRVQARDERGLVGGYRWQFSIGPGRGATPTPIAAPESEAPPTATLFPIPTRRPTITPFTAPPRPTIALPTPAAKPVAKPTGTPGR